MFRPDLRNRDIEIWHDRLRGNLLRVVGKKHGISRERVRQISRQCEREARNFLFNNKDSRLARELLTGVIITIEAYPPGESLWDIPVTFIPD